jgi:hypothetical protein
MLDCRNIIVSDSPSSCFSLLGFSSSAVIILDYYWGGRRGRPRLRQLRASCSCRSGRCSTSRVERREGVTGVHLARARRLLRLAAGGRLGHHRSTACRRLQGRRDHRCFGWYTILLYSDVFILWCFPFASDDHAIQALSNAVRTTSVVCDHKPLCHGSGLLLKYIASEIRHQLKKNIISKTIKFI